MLHSTWNTAVRLRGHSEFQFCPLQFNPGRLLGPSKGFASRMVLRLSNEGVLLVSLSLAEGHLLDLQKSFRATGTHD